ncbi:dTDP-4-dehydrorhamnose 3,5-epimerase [Pseudoalteromonas sp. Isolate6]|uniref:dTDP-4-dehydrorhamnose 3,5-epimerase n=1 Tax=Pseudoalteromonas sp. Isolate6 TaxID=2908527 RepID=UPI001EFCC53D|nr:dTDP-4-dehydrorhamnose 3,5-epimerase [Pseudoalteromonas sp. Isolate6]MCG9761179.1 dTDP-4-dehydrorhamnose 3,5-epimerase [Pseudoalteromonas sp. Isolate6]
MNVIDTNIPAVKIIEPRVFEDSRGFFMETWNQQRFEALVTHQKTEFVQDNHSKSSKGILRGLHLQKEHTQGKLVRVVSGEVFDVAVDLRKGSPTYGQWVGEFLSADNKRQLWVPEGFGHGFYVVSEHAEFVYKCTDYYHPQSEVTIAWDDKELAIKWPFKGQPLLSEKDKEGISLKEFQY